MFEELKDKKIRKLKAYKAIILSFKAIGYDIVDDIKLVKFLDNICNLEEFKNALSSIAVLCSNGILSKLESKNYIIQNDKHGDIQNALEKLSKEEKQFDIELPIILTEQEIERLKWLNEFDLNKDGHIYNFGNVQIAILDKHEKSKYSDSNLDEYIDIYQIRVKRANEENWNLIYYYKEWHIPGHSYLEHCDYIVLEKSDIIDELSLDNIKIFIDYNLIFKKYIESTFDYYEKKVLFKKKKKKK